MRTCLVPVVGVLTLLTAQPSHGQGTRSDYARAAGLRQRFAGTVFKARVVPHWAEDGTNFWYLNDLPGGGREVIRVDAGRGTRGPAFDHEKLAAALAAAGVPARADRLPIGDVAFDARWEKLRFTAGDARWECDLGSYALRKADGPGPTDLPLLPRPRPTRRTGAEISLRFVNRTRGPVELRWLDFDGEGRTYATLRPGEEYHQPTFAGHVWELRDAGKRPLAVFEAPDESRAVVIDDAFVTRSRRSSATPAATPAPEARPDADSPDGRWTAVVKHHNVFLRPRAGGDDIALSAGGTPDDGYTGEFHWSPDSARLVAMRRREAEARRVYLIESSPRTQLQPKLHSLAYPKPGDRLPVSTPRLFDVAARRELAVDAALFPAPWAIDGIRWEPGGRRFTFVYNQRGHQVLRVIAVPAAGGPAAVVVDETSRTFVDYAHKRFERFIDRADELVWMSERDGWNHLYLIDTATGRVKNQITRGEWVVRGVDRVDDERRQIWFRAGGIRPGQDPYFVHHARVNFDGTGLTVLTEGDGTHQADFSPDGRFFLDTYSRVDEPPVTELRRSSDGTLVCRLERADVSALRAAGWRPPEPFAAKGRDGVTEIYGVIYRPTNFDPGTTYPVIEDIYAGPHGSFVPKEFAAYRPPQALADLGFVVVQIDGMGTSNRSKAFHDVCWKNLGDSGFPDRIAWLRAAARHEPALDLSRVGIYGGSAGGQSALRALLAHGEFYTVAVADCGCHDNRMDKVWWNELWMGWPVGPHYAAQSNVTNAHRLTGKLLLIVGELDRNVDPASTMQVADALIKADKDFDLLVIPGAGHGAGESPYGVRRRRDFFVRHLLGVEPRSRP